jgi:hypothetical protein
MFPKSLKLLLTVLSGITFLLQGCATGIPFSGLAPIPENRALLYLYREGQITGAAGSNEIYINGKPTVDLKSGGYFVAAVDPGPVAISHRPTYPWTSFVLPIAAIIAVDRALEPEKKPKITFTAEANHVYYVEGMLAGKIELRDRDTAFPVLKNCKLLSPIDH